VDCRDDTLSLVIPVYNEEESLEQIVNSSIECLGKVVLKFEVIVVDDGSSDKTSMLAEQLSKKNEGKVIFVRHAKNMGFGQALRTGFSKSQYDTIMFNPADNILYPDELKKKINLIKKNDIVLGFRNNRQDYSLFRNFSSWAYRQMVNIIFAVRFPDITWVAVCRRKVWEGIDPQSKGGFILTEVLIKAKRKKYKIAGLYVHYEPRSKGVSKWNKPLTILRGIWEMFKNSF